MHTSGKHKDKKCKVGNKSLHNFTQRKGIFKQRKRNNKSQFITVTEGLPYVKNSEGKF